MHDFAYHRPASLGEAKVLLRSLPQAALLAGGMSLIPTLKQRQLRPSDLIDLAEVEALRGIREEGGALVIGAMTDHAAVAANMLVLDRIPALAGLAGGIGDPQVRNRGTLGGALVAAEPATDYAAALLALGADIITDSRSISAQDFFTEPLERTEIITAVSVPIPQLGGWEKLARSGTRTALAGVFVAQRRLGVRVAVIGAAPRVFRAREVEAALAAKFSPAALSAISIEAEGLVDDIHGSADYRAHLVGVLAARAVAAARAHRSNGA